MKALKQKLAGILAQAKGTRWDVVACRVCGILSVVAGLGQYAGFIPGRTGSIVAGVSGGAAALLPRATKAAGLLTAAYNQKMPFLKVLPVALQTLLAGPSIIAEAKAEDKALAEEEKQRAVNAQIDQAVEKKISTLTFDELVHLTGEFARADLAQKVPDLEKASGAGDEKAPDVPEPPEEPQPAPEAPTEAYIAISSAGVGPAIAVTGGNQ